jgi:histidyl-tRNA synthetase
MDDRLKQLLRELGHAINETVADSERIAEAIANVRAAGFDIVLRLDATIGLARRDAEQISMTTQDRRFLESLHIRVDEEAVKEEVRQEANVDVSAMDIKFLKSLKISLDENL